MIRLFQFLYILCSFNAFSQSFAPLNVKVIDYKSKVVNGEKISFIAQDKSVTVSGVSNQSGTFSIQLPAGKIYDIKIVSFGDDQDFSTLEIPVLEEGQEFEKMELEISYEAPVYVALGNLEFETGKATIQQSSLPILDKIAEILANKSTMSIEIIGHTDADGEVAENLTLSINRAKAVKDYLVSKGINTNRMISKGYGETRPLVANTSPENKAKNRRTEIQVSQK